MEHCIEPGPAGPWGTRAETNMAPALQVLRPGGSGKGQSGPGPQDQGVRRESGWPSQPSSLALRWICKDKEQWPRGLEDTQSGDSTAQRWGGQGLFLQETHSQGPWGLQESPTLWGVVGSHPGVCGEGHTGVNPSSTLTRCSFDS